MMATNNESLAVLEVRKVQINLLLGKYLVGSGETCDIIIKDSTVEQRHALLIVQQHCIKIIDLLTESGTYVDNENICNGGFNDIVKSVSLKFGSVYAQLRLLEEIDSGFLGFSERDSLDIIPLSPQACSSGRRNSGMGHSRIRSKESNFQNDFRTPDIPSVNSPRVKQRACNDMFLANVTDVNIRKTIEQMTEEDEYYVPETQEIFERRPQSPKDNANEGIFRITTQEFKEGSDENISSNEIDNASLVIPLIRHSPILIMELQKESPTICKTEQETRSEEPSAVVDVKTNDTETEISKLKWDESTNNSAALVGDLNGVKSEKQIKEDSSTPDLELTHIRSGSTTPDLFLENETSPNKNIDIDEHIFSPTQIFQPKKLLATNSNTSSNQEQVHLNVSSNNPNEDPDLEVTQPFVLRVQVNPRTTTNSPSLLKNDGDIFVRPLPKPPITLIDADSEEYDNAEPTQPFILKDRSRPSTSADNDDDFDQFAETQRFEVDKKKHRSVTSVPILLSDDEDKEYCLRETICVGEAGILGMPSRSSINMATSKQRSRQVEQEDDIFDIQPTPRTDVIKLPNESVINNVENLFNKGIRNRKRRASFCEDSFSEDDNVFIKETETNEQKTGVVKKKNVLVRMKKDRKSDEAIKEQNLLSNDSKDVSKKDTLSDQSTANEGRRGRGRPRKIKNSNEKNNDKVKQSKISKIPNLEKNEEDQKMSGDVIRKQRGRPKYTKSIDGKSEEAQREKKEIPLKETRPKKTKTTKTVPLKMSPQKPTTSTSKAGFSRSEYGDFPEECPINLHRTRSERKKSIPSYIADDYYTGSDLEDIGEEEEIKKPKTSRRKAVTKNLKEDPKKCPNLQKSSNNSSLDDSEKSDRSNEALLKCSTGRNAFYTSTPSVRKCARHHICFTRVDSSRYADIMQRYGCKIENDPMNSSILVAAKITRTWKMLASIARGLPIVSPDWFKILESNYNESYSYDDYLLQDPSAEQQYKFNLKKSLQAARKKPIFKNFTFLITPQTQPNPVEMTKIIESGGGSVITRYPRDIQDLSDFYIISTREDDALWKRFKTNAGNVPIYSSEAVMSAVMQQCINFKHHKLL